MDRSREPFAAIQQRLFVGLKDPEIKRYIREGLDFVYVDHPYFFRDDNTCFRMVWGATHLTTLLDRPRDRMKRRGMPLPVPWRKNGREVIVIPPSPRAIDIFDEQWWLMRTVAHIKRVTDRPVRVKHNKLTALDRFLQDAWCVVTFGSVAGVEAAMMGVPVFSGPICPTRPISAGEIDDIEKPVYAEREPWMASLNYATWRLDELHRMNLENYQYL